MSGSLVSSISVSKSSTISPNKRTWSTWVRNLMSNRSLGAPWVPPKSKSSKVPRSRRLTRKTWSSNSLQSSKGTLHLPPPWRITHLLLQWRSYSHLRFRKIHRSSKAMMMTIRSSRNALNSITFSCVASRSVKWSRPRTQLNSTTRPIKVSSSQQKANTPSNSTRWT